jgi:multiple sugar transport system permease protein
MDLRKYLGAEKNAELIRATGWSLFVTVSTEVMLVLAAFPAAYALARIPSPLTGLVETMFGAGFLVPVFALLLPTFLLVAKLGLLFKPTALIFVYPGGLMPFAVLFLANYLRTIPRELEESALVDGANRFQVMTRVMFPLAMPGIVTVLVLMFITVWNEYVFAFVMSGRDFRTVQIALTELKALRRFDVGEASAGVLMSIAPVYLMFIFFQERIISGLTRGALKG